MQALLLNCVLDFAIVAGYLMRTASQVMDQFRDVYIDRQKALGNVNPILPKAKHTAHLFKDKETIFQVALESALRKPEPHPQIVLTEYQS